MNLTFFNFLTQARIKTKQGELLRKFLCHRNFTLLNKLSITKGGPFTRVDPSDQSKQSCIDYAIVSTALVPFVEEMIIDNNRTFIPKRVGRNGDDKSTDHYSFIINFRNLPLANQKSKKEEVIIWDTKKTGGWKKYKELMEECSEFDDINDDESLTTTEAFAKINKLQDKIKYQAFGKVRFKKVKVDNDLKQMYAKRNDIIADINDGNKDSDALATIDDQISSQIIATQRKELVTEKEAINKMRITKGQMGTIFDMKNRLLGNKKKPERESTAVINFRTKELEVAPERIYEVSLDYVSNLLENDVPDDDVKDDVTLTNTIHIVRKLRQHRNEDEETVNEEDIAEVFEK